MGLVIIWKYLFCILWGDNFCGEFYLIVVLNGMQQVDFGIKMIYFGKNMMSWIILKGIVAGYFENIYCGLVLVYCKVIGVCNFINCDLLFIGN